MTLGLLVSCNSDYIVDTPEFTVSGPVVVKAGQDVVFNLTGDPDLITFYSGEPGKAYEYSQQDRIGQVQMQMSFMTTTTSGTPGSPNPSALPLYYSTDFSGVYTNEAVLAATWTEITDRFEMPDDTDVSNKTSGVQSVDDIFPKDGSPVFLMFSYNIKKYEESLSNGRTQWSIKDLNIDGVAESGTQAIYDIKSCGWQFVYGNGMENNVSQFPELPGSNARILFRVDYRAASDMQLWVVSGPLQRPESVNLGPDRGTGIKTSADPALRQFKYAYTKPGEYVATFVAVNANASDRREKVEQVRIVVEEGVTESQDVLDIKVSTLECKAGEPIAFEFSGDAETLDFWSGEPGHDYQFINGGKPESAQMYMQFRTYKVAGAQRDNLKIKYSADFNGVMDEDNILKATWTDISSRFTWPDVIQPSGNPNSSATTYANYVKSGNVLVTDCYEDTKQVYFAMFWEIEPYDAEKGNTRTVAWVSGWQVSALYTSGDPEMIFDLEESTETEKVVEIVEGASYGSDTNHCGWYSTGNFTADLKWHFRFFSDFRPAEGRKAYALTKQPVIRGSKITGADTPHRIKTNMQNSLPATWSYTYAQPGTYNVVFVIGTLDENGAQKTETKEFTIVVTE